MSSNQLRCHPIGGTDDCVSLLLLLCQLCSIAEVRDFDFSLVVQKNVVTLDITMNSVEAMDIAKCFQSLKIEIRQMKKKKKKKLKLKNRYTSRQTSAICSSVILTFSNCSKTSVKQPPPIYSMTTHN